MKIRRANVADMGVVYDLLRSSANEQDGLEHLVATPDNLMEDGFGDNSRFHILVAEQNGLAVGLALFFFIYSTWTSRNSLYLEDLYVRPDFRKQGIARELMRELARVAKQNGCGRMIWLVLRKNLAVDFYKRVGAGALEEWMPMQMKTAEIEALAK